ncbi:hypothetical protein [Pseudaestuariivita sp.]|uniref:hypothetical protein n=1 Tax=Pseudaestuariivita sp. TaxID=2211669 RepID=UPI00405923D9
MIAGIPGCGKSRTCVDYLRSRANVIAHVAVAGECTKFDLLYTLSERLYLPDPNSRRMAESCRSLGLSDPIGA